MGFDPLDVLDVVLVAVVARSLEEPPVSCFEVELAAFPLGPVSNNVSTVAEDPAWPRGSGRDADHCRIFSRLRGLGKAGGHNASRSCQHFASSVNDDESPSRALKAADWVLVAGPVDTNGSADVELIVFDVDSRDRSGIDLGSIWDRSGIDLGSIQAQSWS